MLLKAIDVLMMLSKKYCASSSLMCDAVLLKFATYFVVVLVQTDIEKIDKETGRKLDEEVLLFCSLLLRCPQLLIHKRIDFPVPPHTDIEILESSTLRAISNSVRMKLS